MGVSPMDSRASAFVPRFGNPTGKRGADCNPSLNGSSLIEVYPARFGSLCSLRALLLPLVANGPTVSYWLHLSRRSAPFAKECESWHLDPEPEQVYFLTPVEALVDYDRRASAVCDLNRFEVQRCGAMDSTASKEFASTGMVSTGMVSNSCV
jgi:hypothetical protein